MVLNRSARDRRPHRRLQHHLDPGRALPGESALRGQRHSGPTPSPGWGPHVNTLIYFGPDDRGAVQTLTSKMCAESGWDLISTHTIPSLMVAVAGQSPQD